MMPQLIMHTGSRQHTKRRRWQCLLSLFFSIMVVPIAWALTPAEILSACIEEVAECRFFVGLEVIRLVEEAPTDEARDIALANLAVAFASEQNLSDEVRAAVIRDLALAMTAPEVSQQITEIAATIEDGQSIETAAIGPEVSAEPVLASPN